MITRTDESKTLTKHISCHWKFEYDGKKCNSKKKCYKDKCQCEC